MFWKKKRAILVINRDTLQVVMGSSAPILLFKLPASVIHNLELIDQMGFEKMFQQFLEKELITNRKFTIILDEDFLFWKKFSAQTAESDYFDYIPLPLDQQTHKQIEIDGDVILSAHNSAILTSVQRVLYSKKNTVTSILPFFAFPAFDNSQVNLTNIDLGSIRKVCRYDSEMLKFKPVGPVLSLPLLIGTLILLISSVGLYFWYSHKPQMSKKNVLKEVKKLPLPTPTIIFLNPKDVNIEIKNGSGRFGEAGRLKGTLEKADYTITTIGNADLDMAETEVAKKLTVPDDFISSLSALLSEQYKMSSVSATIPESTSSADVIITIGIGLAQ